MEMESVCSNGLILDQLLLCSVAEAAIAAVKSITFSLLLMGSLPNSAYVLPKEPDTVTGFPITKLYARKKSGPENKDASESEDEEDGDEEGVDDQDEEAGDEEDASGDEVEGKGDPEDVPAANGNGASDEEDDEDEEDKDDDDDDDDDDDGDEETEDEEEDEEDEEITPPPAKRRK